MAMNATLLDATVQEAADLQPLSSEEFLRTVGRRVRQHRSHSRMSRKRLAELSGVSERYLAQLESGQGNMSIILLRRVATAIKLPLDILVSDQGPVALQEQPEQRAQAESETRRPPSLNGSLPGAVPNGSPSREANREPAREPVRETARSEYLETGFV